MNRKIKRILSILVLVTLLTACTIARDADGNIKLISLSTPWSEMRSEGIFSAILIYPIAQAINFLSNHLGVGLAIIIMTLFVNAIVFAFSFKSSASIQWMQEMQPELTKIQKKYEGRTDNASRMRMSNEMNQLYKKYDVNPMGALLTSFIQFPIMIAMYNAVQRSQAVATGRFLGVDLSLTPTVNLQQGAVLAIVLYILMLVFQFLSIALPRFLANRRAKMEAEKHHRHYEKTPDQNAVMSYSMILFIGFIMLQWPSALSLYYLIYSIVMIIRTLLTDYLSHR